MLPMALPGRRAHPVRGQQDGHAGTTWCQHSCLTSLTRLGTKTCQSSRSVRLCSPSITKHPAVCRIYISQGYHRNRRIKTVKPCARLALKSTECCMSGQTYPNDLIQCMRTNPLLQREYHNRFQQEGRCSVNTCNVHYDMISYQDMKQHNDHQVTQTTCQTASHRHQARAMQLSRRCEPCKASQNSYLHPSKMTWKAVYSGDTCMPANTMLLNYGTTLQLCSATLL
jgi:hypothetical protein